MKELLHQYAAYNLWANKILLERSALLPEDILHKEMESSFTSIYKTALHMMEVESIWWQRLRLQEHILLPEKDPENNFDNVVKKLLEYSSRSVDWIAHSNEKKITHVFGYYNSKKEFFKQPVYEMLLHLYNHQTYHRGQIVTMLHQNGITKIPPTDFIVFSRKK